MDLTLTGDQQQLVDAATRFLSRSCDSAAVRAAEASPDGHDARLWDIAAGIGWPALCVPEEHGGSGAGLVELALIAEQMGSAAYTAPLLRQTTLVALPLVWAGTAQQRQRWLPAIASGEAIGAPALLSAGARDEWTSPALSASCVERGWRLSGGRVLVPFAGVCDVYSVVANLE
ncbi:MAG: acyl-CoA dehydrogenase family protein, partial [Acidimicrobiales bacterium]